MNSLVRSESWGNWSVCVDSPGCTLEMRDSHLHPVTVLSVQPQPAAQGPNVVHDQQPARTTRQGGESIHSLVHSDAGECPKQTKKYICWDRIEHSGILPLCFKLLSMVGCMGPGYGQYHPYSSQDDTSLCRLPSLF